MATWAPTTTEEAYTLERFRRVAPVNEPASAIGAGDDAGTGREGARE